MSTPMETLDWLAVQFRTRANEDPAENTEIDAREVEAARHAARKMLAALKRVESSLTALGARGQPLKDIRTAIAMAEGAKTGETKNA